VRFRAELEPLRPYKPPHLARELEADYASDSYVKLTMNELSFGPLPEAEAALRESLTRANRYPERNATALRESVVAANPGTTTANVLIGNGSSEVIFNLLAILQRPGEIVYPWPSFSLYPAIARILGFEARTVRLDAEHAIDPGALLEAVTDWTRAVVLCNPNNPTGTYLELAAVRELAEALPEDVLLILDEAYYEFVSDPAYAGSHELALERPNVVSARTFSKVHGLAGLRVGYGLAPEPVADYFERVRFPFSVNLPAQAAATASMREPELISKRARFVIEERERLQPG
jgi:histidinol-phosphate aminotransferase